VEVNGLVGLQYSPVIFHNDRGSITGETVSLCQSFYRVALLSKGDADSGVDTGGTQI
jgi:hypothetical protein